MATRTSEDEDFAYLALIDVDWVKEINKGNPKTKDTKIIVMSARKNKEDVLWCFNLGVDDYLVKPFALDDFELFR